MSWVHIAGSICFNSKDNYAIQSGGQEGSSRIWRTQYERILSCYNSPPWHLEIDQKICRCFSSSKEAELCASHLQQKQHSHLQREGEWTTTYRRRRGLKPGLYGFYWRMWSSFSLMIFQHRKSCCCWWMGEWKIWGSIPWGKKISHHMVHWSLSHCSDSVFAQLQWLPAHRKKQCFCKMKLMI